MVWNVFAPRPAATSPEEAVQPAPKQPDVEVTQSGVRAGDTHPSEGASPEEVVAMLSKSSEEDQELMEEEDEAREQPEATHTSVLVGIEAIHQSESQPEAPSAEEKIRSIEDLLHQAESEEAEEADEGIHAEEEPAEEPVEEPEEEEPTTEEVLVGIEAIHQSESQPEAPSAEEKIQSIEDLLHQAESEEAEEADEGIHAEEEPAEEPVEEPEEEEPTTEEVAEEPVPEPQEEDQAAEEEAAEPVQESEDEQVKGQRLFVRDYDKDELPKLFKKIEAKEWNDIIKFLDTGSWPGFDLFPDADDPKAQVMTVVTRCDWNSVTDEPTYMNWTRLPLHQAIMKGAEFAVIYRLVKLWPGSVRWTNRDGQLAIHLALLFNASDDVVAFLLLKYPESINVKTKRGYTPIKASLKSGDRSRGLMLAIFVHYTKPLSGDSADGVVTPPPIDKTLTCDYKKNCTKLFEKIEKGDWGEIFRYFETGVWSSVWGGLTGPDKLIPEKAAQTWVTRFEDDKETVHWSQLPLHMAILTHAPFEVTERLVELYPKACLCRDDQGMLPIHLAMYHGACDELVAKLLMQYPESVNVKNSAGRTPLACALKRKNNIRGKIVELFVTKSTKKGKKAMTSTVENITEENKAAE